MKVGILCSGVALGVYIPALHIYRDLKKTEIPSKLYVLEDLLPDDKKSKINQNKIAFHRSFAVAKMGQRVSGDIMTGIDRDKLTGIFNSWAADEINRFIVISGFWISILETYRSLFPQIQFTAECLHIDSDISASWKKADLTKEYYKNRWLTSNRDKGVIHDLHVSDLEPVPFEKRQNRILVHGGGWGMGTYRSKIAQLKEAGFNLDIVAYEPDEVPVNQGNDRYFMMDPDWSPWKKGKNGDYQYPPLAQLIPGKKAIFKNKEAHHELFDVTREAFGVISKPGGSTLLESLAAATPLIMLEPFGEYESKNAELWAHLGFGIQYDHWEKEDFSLDTLKRIHHKMLDSFGKAPKYIDAFLGKNVG